MYFPIEFPDDMWAVCCVRCWAVTSQPEPVAVWARAAYVRCQCWAGAATGTGLGNSGQSTPGSGPGNMWSAQLRDIQRGTLEAIQHRVSVSQRETEEQQRESLQWAAPQSPGEATGASCKCFLSCNYSNLVESSQCNHDSNCVFLKSRFPN